ncbi:MAG TPA: hypothetical protein VFJ85_07590 [Acidimicrobiales bacterium]|nr:hypothetical protein [Acidimicrobiales bacterium]
MGDSSASAGTSTISRPAPARTASLLVGDAGSGAGSLAPTETAWRAPLLLGDDGTPTGSLAPPFRRRLTVRRRPGHVPLEDALAAHVDALENHHLDERRLRALIDRLGLAGRPPLTLAEAGRAAGVSGERVRQLEARLRRHQEAAGRSELPQLDAALTAVSRAVPMPASGVARVLLGKGLVRGAFSAESLICAAELLGREVPFVTAGSGRDAVLMPRAAAAAVAHTSTIAARARRQAEKTGAVNVRELAGTLAGERGLSVTQQQLRLVLDSTRSAVRLRGGWYCFTDARPTGAFVRASYRMLAVTPSLPVESLHDGLRRHNAFRRLAAPAPPAVLLDVYRHHPGFVVEGGTVSAAQPVDPGCMGALNRGIVEILRAAPAGALSRAELLDACHEAGLNLTSVNLYTTYSECIERIATGLLAARGAAARPAPAPRRRAARGGWSSHGWTADGYPWLAGRVTPSIWANGVVHVPADLRAAVGARHFAGLDGSGHRVTTLGVDEHGNSWGWTGFLRRAGADLGDVVRAEFDPAAGTARLEVVRRERQRP